MFHYLQVLDALGIDRFHLAGASIGGWMAAEIAVRIPERVHSLTLIGAAGLFVPQHPIADIFMMVQAKNGGDFSDFRRTLFRDCRRSRGFGDVSGRPHDGRARASPLQDVSVRLARRLFAALPSRSQVARPIEPIRRSRSGDRRRAATIWFRSPTRGPMLRACATRSSSLSPMPATASRWKSPTRRQRPSCRASNGRSR